MKFIKRSFSALDKLRRRALAASERVRPAHAVLLGLSAAVLMLWPADAWPVLLIVAGVAADAA